MHGSIKATALAIILLAPLGDLSAAELAASPGDAPLSLEQAIRRAEVNAPVFAAAAAESRVAALERRSARAALLPSANFHNQFLFTESNHTHTTLGTAGGQFVNQGGVEAALPVFIANNSVHEYYSQAVVNETVGLGQVSAVKLADANAAVAIAELEVARRGLVATVVNLYFSVRASAHKRVIAQRALDEADRFVSITRERENAREAAHADVIKAQIQQQQRQREVAESKLASQKASLELGVLLFPDPAASFTLADDARPAPLPARASVDAAARASNPETRSALASLQASRAQITTAQAALLPDLALNFTYGIDAPQFAANGYGGARNLGYSASATVDVPLWDWFSTEHKVKEAKIRADAAKVSLSAAQHRLLADLAEFYAEAETAEQQLASLDSSVTAAKESLRLTNLRYADGESTVLDVVDAQNTLATAENAQVDGVVRYQLALAQLETLTGRL